MKYLIALLILVCLCGCGQHVRLENTDDGVVINIGDASETRMSKEQRQKYNITDWSYFRLGEKVEIKKRIEKIK